ncbi:28532_t:CDS:2, partial [Gigaspora margarita]
WNRWATQNLYKDPWKYCLYNSCDKKKLISTYMLCYEYFNNANFNRVNTDEPLPKRPCTGEITPDIYIPRYDYISKANNLHIPVLYKCIESWYASTKNPIIRPDEITDDMRLNVNDKFFQLLKMFIDRALIKECTFHESQEFTAYPIQLQHLNELITTLFNRHLHLRYLNLGYFNCNDNGLEILTDKCTALETFKIKAYGCSDEALAKFLRAQRKLTKLKIRDATEMRETMNAIGTLSQSIVKLRILNCNLETCTSPFTNIGECTRLRSLYMRCISFTTNTSLSQLLMPIAQNCEFHNIDFSKTPLPVEVLIEIAKKSSTTLRRVHLVRPDNDTQYLDLSAGIEALAQYATNLRHFERDILPSEIDSTSYFLNSIGQSLERLEIDSNMDGRDMSNLIETIGRKCQKLCVLNISNFEFNLDAFEELVNGCRLLHTLNIDYSQSVNDRVLELLVHASSLQTLYIKLCPNVSVEEIERFHEEREFAGEREVEVDELIGNIVDGNYQTVL